MYAHECTYLNVLLYFLNVYNFLAQDDDEEGGPSSSGRQISALGFCEGREGEQSVRIKFLLTDESQLSSPSSLNR